MQDLKATCEEQQDSNCMDSTTEGTLATARYSETATFPLFAVLFAGLGAVLIIVATAIWCRVCRRHQQAEGKDEQEQDERLEVAASERRISSGKHTGETLAPGTVGRRVSTEVGATVPPRELWNRSDQRTRPASKEIRSRDNGGMSVSSRTVGTSGERLPAYYGSSHSLHGEEFPRQVSEFRNLSTDEAVTSSVVAEELLPAENVSDEVAEGLPHSLGLAVTDRVATSTEDTYSCEYLSMRLQQQCSSQFFGLDLSSEKLQDTLLQDDPRMVDSIAQMPFRVPSTDMTELEHSLDYWHQQHSRQNYSCTTHGEDEPQSKVRYNDTGSLEEVNHEHQVDYVVRGGEDLRYISCGQSAQYQYRQLWSLRATLAKNEYLLNQRVMNKETVTSAVKSVASFKRSQSSVDIYPGSAVEIPAGSSVGDGAVSYSSEEISRKTRRQTYISTANSRMQCTEVQNVYQCDILSFDDSHDSFDTIDNECYSTDTSIIDEPQNYGIDGSSQDRQTRRLQQLRADSGYRSLENPPASNFATHQQSFDMAARLSPLNPISDTGYHIEMPVCYNTSRDSQGGDFSTKHKDSIEGVTEPVTRGCNTSLSLHCHEPDEGVAGLNSPPPTVTKFDFGPWERCQRQKYHSASRKRREFCVGGGRHALAHIMTDAEYSRPYVYQNFGATYPRDYSVDEKSDALFREFSRCDPVKMRPSNSHRQQPTHSFPYPVQEQKSTLLEPLGSDEEQLPQGSLLLDVTREESGYHDSHEHCRVNYDNEGDDYEEEEDDEDDDDDD